jgi:CheY-like chemotaxis protein
VVANTLAAFVRRVNDELDLKKARLEADQANRAKTEFLAHMSHEIRTPMNGILGLAELALGKTMDSEARSLVEGIKASGETLLSLVNDILDVSKIEAGKLELESTSFSLVAMVDAALSPLRVLAAKKGLALNLEWSEGLDDQREGDPTRIRQILLNLAGNAVKFTSQGSVTLSIGPGEREGTVRFVVRDTGPGVPSERQGRLFLRYSQLEASTNRQFGGTGLGLAICRELVDRMGGSLGYLDAKDPAGSVFWFSIPLATATAPLVTAPQPSIPAATRRELRVLVVEDNVVNQQVATGLLRRHGVEATVAQNGLEALDRLATGAFDLVLMDVQMPMLDGLTATRAIRRGEGGERHRHVPIVAMTANAMQGDKDDSLAAGMDDYLTKPISAAKMAALLEKWDRPAAEVSPVERRRRVFDPEEMRSRLQLEDEFVQQIVQLFLDDLPTRRRNLVAAHDEGRLDEVHRLAHTLKGTAANLVAQGVVDAAEDLETAAAQGDAARAEQPYQAVLAEIDELETALTEFLR